MVKIANEWAMQALGLVRISDEWAMQLLGLNDRINKQDITVSINEISNKQNFFEISIEKFQCKIMRLGREA